MYTERWGLLAKRVALPAQPDWRNGGLVHLVAISFDAIGKPMRLFIPNRWVADEWLYPARHVVALLDHHRFTEDRDIPVAANIAFDLDVHMAEPGTAIALKRGTSAIC